MPTTRILTHRPTIWDRKAPFYQVIREFWPLKIVLDQENQNVRKLLSGIQLKNARVADIGCGSGNSLSLVHGTHTRIGIDASMAMLRRVPESDEAYLTCADGCVSPFGDGVFDLALSVGLCEYLKCRRQWIFELARIVCDDGHVLVTSSPPGSITKLRRVWGSPLWEMHRDELVEIAHSAGLVLRDSKKSVMQQQFLFQKN